MKTTTILRAVEETMNQHNFWMDAYKKNPRNHNLLRMGERRAKQHSRLYAALLSRIEAGDRARGELDQAVRRSRVLFEAGLIYKTELDKAREALKIYADPNNWAYYDGAHWAGPDPYDDGYALAREALGLEP